VITEPLHAALQGFVNFLGSFPNALLVAHNAPFDIRILVNQLRKNDMLEAFRHTVVGFTDSKAVFKEKFSGRKSYKQTDLVADLLSASYDAHNAIGDVQSLQSLLSLVSKADIRAHSNNTAATLELREFLEAKKDRTASLLPLVKSSTITNYMAGKLAESGLSYRHVRLAFQRGGCDGLDELLRQNFGYLPRKDVLRKMHTHLMAMHQ
jgi:DNA polymerase III alpha subunit (gram-positive type)